MHVKWQLI